MEHIAECSGNDKRRVMERTAAECAEHKRVFIVFNGGFQNILYAADEQHFKFSVRKSIFFISKIRRSAGHINKNGIRYAE